MVIGIGIFLIVRFLLPVIAVGKTERIGMTGRYRVETLPAEIQSLAGKGLTKLDENGVVEPDLAKSWETPDKGKTWIFYLRDEIYWQDESEVTTENLNYEFLDVEIEIKDEKTIIFKLEEVFSPFPSILSKPVFKRGLLGSGDWEVTKIRISGNFVQNLTLLHKDGLKRIYRFYPTEERTKLAFKLGEIDKILYIFNEAPFASWKTAEVASQVDQGIIVSIFFDGAHPVLGEKSFRQGLAYAINKEELPGERALGPVSPLSWVYNPQVKTYSYNPSRAKELVEDTESFNQDEPVRLVTTPILLPVAEQIKGYWEEVGVKTVVQVSSGVPQEYDALLAMFAVPNDPDQYSIWHSTQLATNISNYKSPRIDKLLEDGRNEINQTDRRKIYLDFQRFLVEDSPAAFLYHPDIYTIRRK